MMWGKQAGRAALVLGLARFLTIGEARASYLYWSKVPVQTGPEAKCMQLAHGVARQNGLQNIRRGPLEIAGSKQGVYVAITCIGRGEGQRAMAVVMAMGDAQQTTIAVRDEIAGKLSKTGFID